LIVSNSVQDIKIVVACVDEISEKPLYEFFIENNYQKRVLRLVVAI
jgi:hypothetical protein